MNQRAHSVSLYLSGMPVKTSTVKLTKTRKCIQRWNTLNRRYSMRVRTFWGAASAVMVSPVEAILDPPVDVQGRVHEGERKDHRDEDKVEDVNRPDRDRRAQAIRVDVHHETGEVLVGPRMTLGAGGDEVLLRHLALGVGRRQDLVTAVTVRADGGLGGAEVGRLAVVAVQVGLQLFRVTARAESVDGSAESRSVRRGDVVRHVAIGADGRLAVGLAKHEVAVERAAVHGEHVGVTVVARRELRRHQPCLRRVGPVRTGLEADVLSLIHISEPTRQAEISY